MPKYNFHHSGQYVPGRKEEVISHLAVHYMTRDLDNYDMLGPQEQASALDLFSKRHKLKRTPKGKDEAHAALERKLSGTDAGVLRMIYRDELIEPELQGCWPAVGRKPAKKNPQLDLF